MSKTKKPRVQKQKSQIKKRLEVLEAAATRGLDRVLEDVHGLYQNQRALAEAMEALDSRIAGLQLALRDADLLAQETIDAAVQQVVDLRDQIREQKAASEAEIEALNAEAQKAVEERAKASGIPFEVQRQKERADEIGVRGLVPASATVYGG